MSTDDSDDMDVFVILRKLDKHGKALQSFNIPFKDLPDEIEQKDLPWENVFRYIGPNGRLRASHRAIAEEPDLTAEQRKPMTEAHVWHPHDKAEKLEKGKVYKLEISLWPGGMIFDAGESICLEVKGFHPVMPEFEGILHALGNANTGKHRVHTGGEYPSSLLLSLSTTKVPSDNLRSILR